MGIQFALEGVKEYLASVKESIKSRFYKYETWEKEITASAGYLANVHVDWKVTGILMQPDVTNMVAAVTALNKILDQIKKKTPVDFTKIGDMATLRKVGFDCTPDMLDSIKYLERSWAKPVGKNKALKDLGWNGGKAVAFAKGFSLALKGVGDQKTYESWVTSVVNEYTSSKDREKYKTLSKVVKQAQQVVKVRHTLLVDLYKQYQSLKKTI